MRRSGSRRELTNKPHRTTELSSAGHPGPNRTEPPWKPPTRTPSSNEKVKKEADQRSINSPSAMFVVGIYVGCLTCIRHFCPDSTQNVCFTALQNKSSLRRNSAQVSSPACLTELRRHVSKFFIEYPPSRVLLSLIKIIKKNILKHCLTFLFLNVVSFLSFSVKKIIY